MNTVVTSNSNIVYNCHSHRGFCPKSRRKVLVPPIDARLKQILNELVEKWGQELVELEVMPDHVHILLGCEPQFGSHKLVRLIKGASSRMLRQEFPVLQRKLPCLWTGSHYCGTTGGVTIEVVRQSVESQKGV